MNRMENLQNTLKTLIELMQSQIDNDELDNAKSTKKQIEAAKEKIALQAEIDEQEQAKMAEKAVVVQQEVKKEAKKDIEHEFAKAIREVATRKETTPAGASEEEPYSGLRESNDEAGGYTVPEDIQTRINHWKEAKYSLLSEISVEKVKTIKGSRTYQKRGKASVFIDVEEAEAIENELEHMKYERISYAIKNRAGFLPVTNDLISDSDANITSEIIKWIGESDIETSNQQILAIISAKAAVDLKDINGIKKVLNVTLGQAFKPTSKIITNDDGLNYLDTLEDKNGRPLLNPDPTDTAKIQLRCGATIVPIRVLPNSTLETKGTKIPFIIGDLKEGIKKYDRQKVTITASTVASIGKLNAFANNMTLFRAICRDDYREIDSSAYVNGYITQS